MKILVVNTLYPPEIVGGAEVSVSLLAQALMRMGHQVAVVCLHGGSDPSVSNAEGIRIYRLPIDNTYWPFGQGHKPPALQRLGWHLRDVWNRRAARRFAEVLATERPDVVHTNNLTGLSVSLWAEARRAGIRVVHTLRDYSLICRRATLFRHGDNCRQRCSSCAAFTAPCRFASRFVDAVASNSRFVLERHRALGYFPAMPGRVIYNVVDLGEHALLAHPPGDDLVFGFIGRIEAEKGIQVVLKAVELLPNKGWKLRIAGRGLDAHERSLKASCKSERVEWLGFVNQQDFFATIDVCLVSSVWPEPLPRVLLESISAGRATICSTAGGIPEISGMSALIGSYEPHDHRRLAELMTTAVQDASRWKQRHAVRADLTERFSPDVVATQYLDLYQGETAASADD